MIYGYARVSTTGQDKYGNSLDYQEKVLREAGAERIFSDSYTGMKKHRPHLDEMLSVLEKGDTVVVTKLDRIARSTIHGCELVNELLARGVTVNVLNMGVIDDSTTGKLIRTIFFAFAEFERDMIVQRTNEGKEIARATKPGYREGRKRVEVPFEEYYSKWKKGEILIEDACSEMGVSRSFWYKRVRELGL